MTNAHDSYLITLEKWGFYSLVKHRIPQHQKGELIVSRAIQHNEEKGKSKKCGRA